MKLLADAVKAYVVTNLRNIVAVVIVAAVTTFFPAQVATVIGVCDQVKVELTQE